GVGLLDRTGVPGAARLDARLRARGDLADRDDLRGARSGGLRPRHGAAAGAGQGARAVGGAPAARARRPGLRPGQARPDARDPRHHAVRPDRLRQPGARLGQLGDPRARRLRRPEGAVPAPAARGRPALRVLDDRAAHRRRRPDAARDDRRARGRRVGRQRPQVVLLERQRRRLPDRDGGHRPRGAPLPEGVDDHRAGRHAGCADPARHPDDGAPGRALRPPRRALGDRLRERPRAEGEPPRAAGRRLPDRPAPPRAGTHPPLHALARRLAAGVRHALRARRLALRARLPAVGEADDPELGRRLRRPDAGRAADDAARRLEDGHRGRERGAAGHRADQVLRRGGDARRRRPRAADPRVAGLLDRPAARGDVPLRARRADLRRTRRGAPPVRRAPDPAGLHGAGGRRALRAHPGPPRAGPRPLRRPAGGGDLQRL
ncbi:MAG: Acyl-CoA dehydrogenase, partial [uncultured Solirubrobacteraceae bacterium]